MASKVETNGQGHTFRIAEGHRSTIFHSSTSRRSALVSHSSQARNIEASIATLKIVRHLSLCGASYTNVCSGLDPIPQLQSSLLWPWSVRLRSKRCHLLCSVPGRGQGNRAGMSHQPLHYPSACSTRRLAAWRRSVLRVVDLIILVHLTDLSSISRVHQCCPNKPHTLVAIAETPQ